MSWNVLGGFSFVLSPPPPSKKSLLKIAFVLHLGQSFQLQVLLEAGELVLPGSSHELILGWIWPQVLISCWALVSGEEGARDTEFSGKKQGHVSWESQEGTPWHPSLELQQAPACCFLRQSLRKTFGPSQSETGMCGFGESALERKCNWVVNTCLFSSFA